MFLHDKSKGIFLDTSLVVVEALNKQGSEHHHCCEETSYVLHVLHNKRKLVSAISKSIVVRAVPLVSGKRGM